MLWSIHERNNHVEFEKGNYKTIRYIDETGVVGPLMGCQPRSEKYCML